MRFLSMTYKLFLLLIATTLFVGCGVKNDVAKQKFVIELIGDSIDKNEIKSIASVNGASDNQLYQWNNHLVLFTHLGNIEAFTKQVSDQFPEVQLKIYDKPFYNFSKAERCKNASIASEWKHVLLTANLVEDETLQREYMEYHRTQFEEWPEIAEGFCNADFQQLLMYRNGRQLMLIISVPADKTLDELNPKTVENNPRMDEWNQLIGKYQEGIQGTKPNEKWVFLNEVE